jgi:hypothetical protein
MRSFTATYRLADGSSGTLQILARSTFDAWDIAADTFGDDLCRIDIKPA